MIDSNRNENVQIQFTSGFMGAWLDINTTELCYFKF